MFNSSSKNFGSLVNYTEGLFVTVIFRILFGFALVYFLINVYRLIKDGANADGRKEHQHAIMWSLVAMAVMFSVWSLVGIITGSFGEPNVLPQIDARYIDSF